MNEILYYLYVLFSFVISLIIVTYYKPKHFFTCYIIIFFIFTNSILYSQFFGEFRLDRVVLIIFLLVLLFEKIFKPKTNILSNEKIHFIKYMNWFFFLYLVVQLIHYFHYQNFNNFLSDTTQAFTFYIIFHVVLKHSDDNYRNSIIAGLLITVALSSLISVYQFFVDTYFFRFGVERPAFGGIFRGNGVFLSDHIQAYFLIPAIFYILLFCKKSLLRDSILILMILGLIVSFHRMSIIAFIVLFLIYLVKIKNKSFKKVFVFFLIIGVIGYLSVKDSLLSSDIYQERISEDTGTYRMLFIAIAIDGIINKPIIGQGTRFSPEYFNMVYAYGFGKETASGRGGGIHNSYLLLGYFQGVPVMLLFIIFLIMTVKYFLKLFDLNNEQLYFFVSLHVIMFMLAGMTNGFIIGSEVGILMGISMALGLKNYLMQKLYDISEVKNYNK